MESKTLWMGAVQQDWDENFIKAAFEKTINENVNVKIFRKASYDKPPIGYAFIEFQSIEVAKYAKTVLSNKVIPGTTVVFHLNWAIRDKKRLSKLRDVTEHSMFVGDLGEEVTDDVLLAAFQQNFSSCSEANVVIDPITGQSRKYGFVRFGSYVEYQAALNSMNGTFVGSRAIRVGYATSRRQDYDAPLLATSSYTSKPQDTHSNSVIINNIGKKLPQSVLKTLFSLYGSIVSLQFNETIATIHYSTPEEAYRAVLGLNGKKVGGSNLIASFQSSQPTGPKHQHYSPPQFQLYSPNLYSPTPAYQLQSYQEIQSFNITQNFAPLPNTSPTYAVSALNYVGMFTEPQVGYYGFPTQQTDNSKQSQQ